MKGILRKALAVIAAFIGGGVFVLTIETIGHKIYPQPADLEELSAFLKSAPLGVFLFVLLAQSAGAFMGGFIAGLIGKSNIPVMIYAVLALTMAILTLVLVWHPIWFVIVALILPIPLVLIGGRIGMSFGSKEA